jgi:hypothetical protein
MFLPMLFFIQIAPNCLPTGKACTLTKPKLIKSFAFHPNGHTLPEALPSHFLTEKKGMMNGLP